MSATKTLATAFTAVFLAVTSAQAGNIPAIESAAKPPLKTLMNDETAPRASAKTTPDSATFVYRFYEPTKPNGQTIVLLHGSGGDETSLVALARQVAPDALLVGVRGRVVQDGISRWYKRVTPVSFDQNDIRAQADAFAQFFQTIVKAKDIDLTKTTFLGYSNGANLVGALTLLHPGMVKKAIMLRPMPVLDQAPKADLSKARFLTVAGDEDALYSPFAPKLEKLLRGYGANVDARMIHSGHLLGDEDTKIVAEWMAEPTLASTKQDKVVGADKVE